MHYNDSITSEILVALNIAVLERLDNCSFVIIGNIPDWFVHFYSNSTNPQNELNLDKFSFLENFLIDAEEFWLSNSDVETLKSGIWSEVDDLGNECNFEASAICLRDRKILLIELLKFNYDEKHYLIQTGRENKLIYHHFNKQIQEKEILLYCVLHDLAGQLSAINCCFELLKSENLTNKGLKYLEIGRKQSTEQAKVMQEILSAFSAEVESLEAFTFNPEQAPDAAICAQEVVNALSPTFSINKMQLQLKQSSDPQQEWKVVGEKSRLERVLFNLVENALRHSPSGSTVTVELQDDREFILFTVEDEGSGVPPEISETLFRKFSQGQGKSGRAGLGLYFCRITVERWGGTIGYSPRNEGGSRFWVRLPKPVIR